MLLTDQPIWNIHQRNKEGLFLESYEKGEEILLCDGEVWQVYRGVMQLSKINSKGEETVVGWITPDRIFGNLFNHQVSYRLVALADIYARRFKIQEIQQSPNIIRALISEFSYHSIQSQKLLAIKALRRVDERLWHLLLMLSQEIGHTTDNGIRLNIRFTHQNLAKVICTTRVTITRVLGDFQNRGWLEFDEFRHIVIKTSAILSNYCSDV